MNIKISILILSLFLSACASTQPIVGPTSPIEIQPELKDAATPSTTAEEQRRDRMRLLLLMLRKSSPHSL